MKFRSTSVLGFLLATTTTRSTNAWFSTTSISTTRPTLISLRTRNAPTSHGMIVSPSLLFSTTAAAIPVEPNPVVITPTLSSALQPTGTPVHEGIVITAFPGGLTAVRINDDDIIVAATASSKPIAFVPDGSLKMETTSNKGDDLLGRQVVFPNGSVGVVVAERFPIVFCLTDSNQSSMPVDGTVKVLNSMANVQVSDQSHFVDCFGRPLDLLSEDIMTTTSAAAVGGGGGGSSTSSRAIFASIPKLKDIALINNPMLTGTTMIDVMAPIGKGQNMLVIGHDVEQMRGFVRDFFATQLKDGRGTKCVYGVTQHRDLVIEELRTAGLLDDVIVVSTRQGENDSNVVVVDEVTRSAEAVAIAATACAIGETFAFQGMNALVVVDTIDQHKKFWDATTRVLVDVYGIDAVVASDREGGASSEMRAFYSSMIQRSSQYNVRLGSGSVTLTLLTAIPRIRGTNNDDEKDTRVFAVEDFTDCSDKIKTRLDLLVKKKIPLTADNLRKIQIPIPSAAEGQRRLVLQHVDDLMSMSDGQIWLDELLEEQGQRPPLDPQKSVTRIGIGADTDSRADAPAIRKVVEGLRLDLAQAASMDGADVTTRASQKQALKRNAWLLAMHQEAGQGGRSLSESCTALLAASKGCLDDTIEKGGVAGSVLGQAVVNGVLQYVKSVAPEAVSDIDQTLDMSPTSLEAMEKAILSYFASRV